MITLHILTDCLGKYKCSLWKHSIVMNKMFTTRDLPWSKCEKPPQDHEFGHLVPGDGACYERLWTLLEVALCCRAPRGWVSLLIFYPVVNRAPCFPTAYLTLHHPLPTMIHRIPKSWANTYPVSLVSVRYGDKIQEALSLSPAAFVTSSWERPQIVGEWLLSLWTSPAGQIGLSITNNHQGWKEQRYCRACRLWRKMPCFIHMMARRTQGLCQHAICRQECVWKHAAHVSLA